MEKDFPELISSLEKKGYIKTYKNSFSWCSVYEPILISRYFDKKNKFLSKYGEKTLTRNKSEVELMVIVGRYNAGCDSFRVMMSFFDHPEMSEKIRGQIEKEF